MKQVSQEEFNKICQEYINEYLKEHDITLKELLILICQERNK
jgi:hypothetical protein